MLRAASEGWLFWVSRGRIAVGRGVLAAALQQASDANTPGRARALMVSSMLARFAGDSTRALRDAESSVSLYEQADPNNPSGLAFALFQRSGAVISFTAERTAPRQDLERGVDLSKRVDDHVMRGICLNMLSGLDLSDGNLDAAEARLVEALSTARMSESPYFLILYLINLASVHADRGRWSESVALDREALELIQASAIDTSRLAVFSSRHASLQRQETCRRRGVWPAPPWVCGPRLASRRHSTASNG